MISARKPIKISALVLILACFKGTFYIGCLYFMYRFFSDMIILHANI